MKVKPRVEREQFRIGEVLDLDAEGIVLTQAALPPAQAQPRTLKAPKPHSLTTRRLSKAPRQKRKPRPRRERNATMADGETLEKVLRSPATFEIAEALEQTLPPPTAGRRRGHPTFMFVVFSMMTSQVGSHSGVHDLFKDDDTWDRVQTTLERSWPQHSDRRVPSHAYTRYAFARFRERHLVVQEGDSSHVADEKRARQRLLNEVFSATYVAQAHQMGYLDPALGSLSRPDLRNIVAGDGTYVPALFSAAKGDMQFDRRTGDLEQIRYDPDAQTYRTADGTDSVRGIGFVHVQVQHPRADGERVTLGLAPVGDGGEAKTAVDLLERLSGLTWMSHYTWDMALRGTHIMQLYQSGLVPVVKAARNRWGKVRHALIEVRTLSDGHDWPLYAVDGALGIEVHSGGRRLFVKFLPVKLRRRPNQTQGPAFYAEYKIPNYAPVPKAIRGERLRVRLDQSDAVAENFRYFNEQSDQFARLHGERQGTESQNNRFKQSLWNGRAHSVGRDRQMVDVLGFHMLCNLKAAVAFQRRTGQDPFGFGGGAIGPPGYSIAA